MKVLLILALPLLLVGCPEENWCETAQQIEAQENADLCDGKSEWDVCREAECTHCEDSGINCAGYKPHSRCLVDGEGGLSCSETADVPCGPDRVCLNLGSDEHGPTLVCAP